MPGLWRHYSKYLDAKKHLELNIRRAQDLNLHRLPPQEILDIGCGGGFFLFAARALCHHGLGLDTGDIPVFDALVDLLRIHRSIYRVMRFEPLPDFGRKFDLITAFATAFHGSQADAWRWGEKEWDFFQATWSDVSSRVAGSSSTLTRPITENTILLESSTFFSSTEE